MRHKSTTANMEHIQEQYSRLFSPVAVINITDGWFWLLSGLCQALDQHCADISLREPLLIRVVEPRLGTLCVQYHGGNAAASKIISAVQIASNQVCQLCGEIEGTGSIFGSAVQTLCDSCWKLDEQFHGTHIELNVFSEESVKKIKDGLAVMPDGWFKKHLENMVKK
jgi:hypothetical protein